MAGQGEDEGVITGQDGCCDCGEIGRAKIIYTIVLLVQ